MALCVWLPLNGNLENKGLTPLLIRGTPTYTSNGKMGKAINLNSRVNFTGLPELKKFTILFWLRVDSCSVNWADSLGFDSYQSDGTAGASFRFEATTTEYANARACSFHNNSPYAITQGSRVLITKAQMGEWHHCGFSCDGKYCYTYIDGVLTYTDSALGGYLYDAFHIGENNNINGGMNDLRIYDECLSKKEIREVAKGLCLHYKFSTPKAIDNLVRYEDLRWFGEGTSGTDYKGSLVQLNETFNKAKVYRFTYTPLTQTALTPLQTKMYQQGVVTLNTRTWLAETKYIYWFLYRPITNIDTTAGLDPNFIFTSHWIGRICTDTIGDWHLGVVYRDGTVKIEQTSKNWIGIKVPSAKLNEPVIVDFCWAHLIKGTDQIIPEFDYEGTVLDYEGDCSGFNYNGPIIGTLEYDDNSVKYQGSTKFNGKGYLQNIKNPLHKDSNEFTISCWFYPTQNSTMALYNDRIATGDGVSIFYLNGGIRFDTGVSSQYQVGTLALNKWNHIACVYNKKQSYKKVYINGVLVGTSTDMGSLDNIGENASIGSSSTNGDAGTENRLYGNLSDFRIYSTALSDKDVLTLYRNRAAVDKKQILYASEFKEAFEYEN